MGDTHDPGLPSGNPIRGRFNAWLLDRFKDAIHEEVGDRKTDFFADLKGSVVEIGAGNGVNFPYYPKHVRIAAYEPNPHMHKRLIAAADEQALDVEIKPAGAEALDFEDNSVDAVVCTLVLCTVPDPEQVIREAYRVLKPDGRFIFIEHVAAEEGTLLRRVQDMLKYPWYWLFEGCHTNRETGALLEASDFNKVEYERYTSKVMPPPVVPQIAGVAFK